MKKVWIGLLLAALLCAACALAEDGDTFALRFDEGFSLSIPAGWVSYAVDDPTIRYALGDGEGRYMYILVQPSPYADFEAMRAAIEEREDCGKPSPLDLNGQPFAAFIVPGLNASGCATLLGGEALTFLFTPQADSDYMLTVAKIMASFNTNLNPKHNNLAAAFPFSLCFSSVNDASASPPSVQLCENEKSTRHLVAF